MDVSNLTNVGAPTPMVETIGTGLGARNSDKALIDQLVNRANEGNPTANVGRRGSSSIFDRYNVSQLFMYKKKFRLIPYKMTIASRH